MSKLKPKQIYASIIFRRATRNNNRNNVIIIHIAHYHFGVSSISLHSLLFFIVAGLPSQFRAKSLFCTYSHSALFSIPKGSKVIAEDAVELLFFLLKIFLP